MLAFDGFGTVATSALDLAARTACLDDFGIALLNQWHAHYFTRYAVETAVLHEQSANVLAEPELLESWIYAAVPDDAEEWTARVEAKNHRIRCVPRGPSRRSQRSLAARRSSPVGERGDP